MFYFDGEKWTPFQKRVTYTQTVIEYDNDVSRFPADSLIEDNTMTDDELARLETVKHSNVSLEELIKYVKTGVAEGRAIEADKANRSRMAILAQIDPTTIEPELLKESGLSRKWEPGSFMSAGELVEHNESLYTVLQPHKSQSDWTPDTAVSLFAPLLTSPSGEILPWVQPESTNPYQIGDKVTHNGKTWINDTANNVWEPGVYGWSEVV